MKKIFENQEIVILSNKELMGDNGYVFNFTDGSSVDVFSRTIINKGPGEIIIRDLPLWPPMSEIIKKQMKFGAIKQLNVSGDMNNIVILPGESTECLVLIGGADDFAQNISVYQRGDELCIETPKSKSNVHIDMGNIWVNGKRLPPPLEENFGYIEIRCSSLHSLYVNGTGAGNIFSDVPIRDLEAKIKGSTLISAIQLENAELNISGSGSLIADELNGSLYGRISGSGSIEVLTGVIENLDVGISGSGDLMIGALVKTASLSLSGSGDMMIAHVLDEYTAQGNGSGSIKVLKVGH